MNRPPNDLHIAYLVQQFPPEIGAGPARVTEMARRWMAAGARVTVITGMPSRSVAGRGYGEGDPKYHGRAFLEEEWDGVRVLRSGSSGASRRSLQTAENASFMLTATYATARLRWVDVLIASYLIFRTYRRLSRLLGTLVREIRDLWPDTSLFELREGLSARALFAVESTLLKPRPCRGGYGISRPV